MKKVTITLDLEKIFATDDTDASDTGDIAYTVREYLKAAANSIEACDFDSAGFRIGSLVNSEKCIGTFKITR